MRERHGSPSQERADPRMAELWSAQTTASPRTVTSQSG
jgi:hypothetical protein